MTDHPEVREALRGWIAGHNGSVSPESIADGTAIVEQHLLTSVQILDLIVFLEGLRGESVLMAELKPGVFRDIDTIVSTFFSSR
ncbi:MAG: hypothetical protein ABI718_13595 [Acidobacteriota bacterium]